MITNKIINNILGKSIKRDNRSKNKTAISAMLLNMIREYPNDFVVIFDRFGSDFKVSEPYTYKEDANKYYKYMSNNLDINWKAGIYTLNKNSLSHYL